MAGARPNVELGLAISQRAATRSPAPTRVLLCSPRPCELPPSAIDAATASFSPWCSSSTSPSRRHGLTVA
ncbi:uncharacterized protein LOC111255641 [Zea mays]|uniref:Uncharacterized protein n=1 Tax=Zea mays TaxID=4577 RepID=A0A804PH49_MAIZE|nr:uncharacterized protein LOC111255641 [Zea mays]|eukprot:NP_001343870.1 uncharacterized protein LOC111255641 [Zea mays]